jgi:hypothetical protein
MKSKANRSNNGGGKTRSRRKKTSSDTLIEQSSIAREPSIVNSQKTHNYDALFPKLKINFWNGLLNHHYSSNLHLASLYALRNVIWNLYNYSEGYVKRLLSKYAVNYENNELKSVSAQILLLVGVITHLLSPHYKVIVKGGKGLQILNSYLKDEFLQKTENKVIDDAILYSSNDIDLTVVSMSKSTPLSVKEVALQIAYFIQWITTHQHGENKYYAPHLSVLDAPKINTSGEEDAGSIIKVSYFNPRDAVPKYTALMDIGYISSNEFTPNDRTHELKEYTLNGYRAFFNVNYALDILIEKIHYIIQYTSPEMLANMQLNKFRESLNRSTYELIVGLIYAHEHKRNGIRSEIINEALSIYIEKYLKLSGTEANSKKIELKNKIDNFVRWKR